MSCRCGKAVVLLLLLLFSVPVSAEKLLKQPLVYVPTDSVLVLPRGDRNVMMEIMAVDPYLRPQYITLTKQDRKAAKKGQYLKPEKLWLLTGNSLYADSLEQRFFDILPPAINDGILPVSVRQSAAQEELDLVGTMFATNNGSDIWMNFFENCTARIRTPKVCVMLDVISEYPEGPEVKLRIGGLPPGRTSFTLRIRVKDERTKYYINGREIIKPVFENGYLVVSRNWKNNEELFFFL